MQVTARLPPTVRAVLDDLRASLVPVFEYPLTHTTMIVAVLTVVIQH